MVYCLLFFFNLWKHENITRNGHTLTYGTQKQTQLKLYLHTHVPLNRVILASNCFIPHVVSLHIRNDNTKYAHCTLCGGVVRVRAFNATFNKISVISCHSVLLMDETEIPGENHRSVISHWQTLSPNVVSSTPYMSFSVRHITYIDLWP